uniref:RRM domain-containing protein n=1 Tax=Glossina palpalis gambiensis TaxID=67801 RepID=A0A1B0BI06_9MUSC
MAFVGDVNDNFIIIDDRAYTEDKILVYNVFLYSIPISIGDDDLNEYFQRYGRIAVLRTRKPSEQDPRYKPTKIGFLNFTDAYAATNVLRKRTHFIKNEPVSVKACDSWHQPNTGQYCSETKMITNDDLTRPTALIFTLNDDCLENICKYLELSDKIQFARACKRFYNVFIMTSKIAYKTLLLDDMRSFTLWQVRQFLEMIGQFVETVKGQIRHKQWMRFAKFFNYYCKNVKSLILYDTVFKARFLRKFLMGMMSLKVLELHCASLNNDCVDILKELPNLRVLRLSLNYDLNGSVLNELPMIEELSLYGSALQPIYLKEICIAMKALRILDVRRCDKLNTMAFRAIAYHCRSLETLKISCYKPRFECIARLPKLKNLELVVETVAMGPELFIELVKHKSDQLESLTLKGEDCINSENVSLICKLKKLKILRCSESNALNNMWLRQLSELSTLEEVDVAGCERITNTGLVDLLRKCRKLKRLNIIRCKQLTEEFILDACNILRVPRRENSLLILAYGSGIDQFAIDRNEIAKCSNFMKLTFDLPQFESRCFDDIDDNHLQPISDQLEEDFF